MKFLKTAVILLVIVVVFGALAFALNFLTGPIIEQNNKGEFGDDVLLYTPDEPGTLTEVGEQVLAIYQRSEGFAIQCKTIGNYEKDPIKLTIIVAADGKISEVKIDEYTDSINVTDKDANFIPSFVGKDSALADVNLVTGCTFSSKSIKEAVEAGLNALISNNLIAAGVKSDEQVLLELLSTVFPAMGIPEDAGVAQGNITAAYKAATGVGYAYIVKDGETSVLAIVNATGVCKVYDTTGADVTDAKSSVVTEVLAHFETVKSDYATVANSKFATMITGSGEMTPIAVDAHNTIVYTASFTANDQTYYGFHSRVSGFGGNTMEIYIVIDENGAIAKMDAKELIYERDYFGTLDKNHNDTEYKNSLVGLTPDSEVPVITGATMTSNAVKNAVSDAFAVYNSVKGGDQ